MVYKKSNHIFNFISKIKRKEGLEGFVFLTKNNISIFT